MQESMNKLLGKSLEELQVVAQEIGLPRFAGKQIAEWLYVKRAKSIDEMSNISLKGREKLKEGYTIGRHEPVAEAVSKDGTKKYLFKIGEQYIESVYIPDDERATLCVSTQAGCKMGCKFCMTGTLGFHGHLDAGDILHQIFSIPDADKLTNIVYMGEGEPMDNLDNVLASLNVMTSAWGCGWSPKRITVSSVGIIKGLKRFIEECDCHLAISLHNPFSSERQEIMPIENSYSIKEVCDILRRYDFTHQRRVSFEYIVLEGMNCSFRHIKELSRLLDGIKCRINLIRFHKIPDSPFYSPELEKIIEFRDTLTKRGIQTTLRASRGEDIEAACGLLSTAEKK